MKTPEQILDETFKKSKIRIGWVDESKQAVLLAMENYVKEIWDGGDKDSFGVIIYNGIEYTYIKRLAKNGEKCLASRNIKDYCNGVFIYSTKDPGNGVEYVVINEKKTG